MSDDYIPPLARHPERKFKMSASEPRGKINHHQQKHNDNNNNIGNIGNIINNNGNGGNNNQPQQAQIQDRNSGFSQIQHNQHHNQHPEYYSSQYTHPFQLASPGQNMDWDPIAPGYANAYQQTANAQYHHTQIINAGFTQSHLQGAAYPFTNQMQIMNPNQIQRFAYVQGSTFVSNHPQNHDGHGPYGPRVGAYAHPSPQAPYGQPNPFMNVAVSVPGQTPYGQPYSPHPVHQNQHQYSQTSVVRGTGFVGGAMGGAMVATPGSMPAAQLPYTQPPAQTFAQHAVPPYAHTTAPPIAHSGTRRNNGRFKASPTQQRAAKPATQPGAQPATQPGAQPKGKAGAQSKAKPGAQPAAQPTAQPPGQSSLAQAVPAQLVVDQSPSRAPSVQPPSAPPVLPQTPSSTQSSEIYAPPTPLTPPQAFAQAIAAAQQRLIDRMNQSPIIPDAPFRPPLPWLSRPDEEFPTRSSRFKGTRSSIILGEKTVSLPVDRPETALNPENLVIADTGAQKTPTLDAVVQDDLAAELAHSPKQSIISVDTSECSGASATPEVTPAASVASLETVALPVDSAAPATPVISAPPKQAAKSASPKKSPKKSPEKAKDQKKQLDEVTPAEFEPASGAGAAAAETEAVTETSVSADPSAAASAIVSTATSDAGGPDTDRASTAPSTPVPAPLWSKLFASSTSKAPSKPGPDGSAAGGQAVNGTASGSSGAANGTGSFSKANANGLGEAVRSFKVERDGRLSLLEPRGLINTGNMCYMNSVLQVLIFCPPFYDFLDRVSKRVAHSFKSSSPLVDAMIMFMREYRVLQSAPSAQQLQVNMKKEEFDRRGEPFTPEFVYEAMRRLPRFKDMTRGHQQDAEEFLGLLFQSLDDECVLSMALSGPSNEDASGSDAPTDDWLEVGRKQRAVVTRSSGHGVSTPITKIFGGLLRSEFRVPGVKDSITEERFQPLQLDIGSPEVNNVVDALRALTRPERIQGDFNSPRGRDVTATKQVLIESLPPVLILHLKRFQFDPEGHGTIKIWKKIGYPLNLEIPREVLSRQTRQNIGESALPQYRLISVVYHHGKNASGGHYTVDVRRQDGQEWIRLDDTAIRRVRAEDIAEVGCEPNPKAGQKSGAPGASVNRMNALHDEGAGDEDGWKQVAPAGAKKQWSSVVNGSASSAPPKDNHAKDNIKDNKVAYLLFYQRV